MGELNSALGGIGSELDLDDLNITEDNDQSINPENIQPSTSTNKNSGVEAAASPATPKNKRLSPRALDQVSASKRKRRNNIKPVCYKENRKYTKKGQLDLDDTGTR